MPSLKVVVSAGAACLAGLSGYCYFSGNPWFFEYVVMPSAHRMDPERVHLAAVYLAAKGLVPIDRSKDPAILVCIHGLPP